MIGRRVVDPDAGIVHSERAEELLLKIVAQVLPRDLFDNLAQQDVTGIAILGLLTRREIGRVVLKPGDQVGASDGCWTRSKGEPSS